MGFGKKKRKVRESIAKWDCVGYFGYGQGRAVAQFGEDDLKGKSACQDICTRADTCKSAHRAVMDMRFPQLTQLTETAARLAKARNLDVVNEVVSSMEQAVEMELDEALEVRERLRAFKVEQLTDHYRCGQFENIQNGLDKVPPKTRRPLADDAKQAS